MNGLERFIAVLIVVFFVAFVVDVTLEIVFNIQIPYLKLVLATYAARVVRNFIVKDFDKVFDEIEQKSLRR